MPNWKKVITSGSQAHLVAVTASSQIAINPVAASTEVGLIVGPGPAGGSGEGGQIALQPASGFTSGSFMDMYQSGAEPYWRVLRGTAASSDALLMQINTHTKQFHLPAYQSVSSFVGTATAALAVTSTGAVITIATGSGGGGGSGTINSGVAGAIAYYPAAGTTVDDTGASWNPGASVLAVTGSIIATANGAMYFRGGDDAEFWDINVANTVGIYGQQTQTVAGLKLGSAGATLYGSGSRFGIGTTSPVATLDVNGSLYVASGITGSLLGTASFAATASYVNPLIQGVVVTGSLKVKNGSTPVLDTVAGTLYDVYGGASVNFGSNQLLNYYGANVVNWGSNYLLSNNSTSATTMSIDWENRYLADTAGTQRLKWTTAGVQVTGSLRVTAGVTASLLGTASYAQSGGSPAFPYTGSARITGSLIVTGSTTLSGSVQSYGGFIVTDPAGVLSADLGAARLLRDSTGASSIDYSNRIHYDATGAKTAINNRFRYLVASNGATTVNWDDSVGGQRLIDSYTSKSVDWGTRQLYDDGATYTATPTLAVDWNNRTVHDASSSGSIAWSSRRLTDQTEIASIRWQNRALCDTGGTGVLEWDMATYQKSLHSIAFSRTEIDLAGSIIDEFSNMNGYPFYPEGRVIKGATLDGAVTDFDFVFLDIDGTWKTVDNVSARATKMLGVAWNVGGDNRVLLEGHLPVNSVGANDSPYVVGVDHGLPIYLSSSYAATTTVPTATGEYVRIIGHAYYQNGSSTDYWMINFNPDHTWVQL